MWKIFVLTLVLAAGANAQQPVNYLVNPDASAALAGWQPSGDARLEDADRDPRFVIRNKGKLQQFVTLPEGAEGAYAVFVGLGSSERINADGAITGLPYLYGLMVSPDGKRFLAHLQGESMRANASKPNTWVPMWGVFRIPIGTAAIWFQLSQAERKGLPQNGSAARFDDLGLFIFATEGEAAAFVARWRETGARDPRDREDRQ
jgi:hypothetical protein